MKTIGRAGLEEATAQDVLTQKVAQRLEPRAARRPWWWRLFHAGDGLKSMTTIEHSRRHGPSA